MAPANRERDSASSRPVSALPSVRARALAFGAILVAGACGGLIGFSAVRVGCRGSCGTPEGVGGITGAVFAALGVSVIAVLVLRAMGEWRSITDKRRLDMMIGAASAFAEEEAARAGVAEATAAGAVPPAPAPPPPAPVDADPPPAPAEADLPPPPAEADLPPPPVDADPPPAPPAQPDDAADAG